MKKKKLIQLKNIGNTWKEVRDFGSQLISELGDDIFNFKTKQELLFNILKQIYPINKNLKLDDISIEIACEKIIKKFRTSQRGQDISIHRYRT